MTGVLPPNNLPLQATPFIGREREINEVLALLRQPYVRLLTLTGPGGTGKTRLSLEAAANALPNYPDGAFFVVLENITDAHLVIPTIAQALGVSEVGGQSLLDALNSYLAGKQMLLVLDNFEQVIAAATTLGELLDAAPKLKALISSRVALNIYGEQDYPVPPLDLPDLKQLPAAAELAHNQAIALFVQRAQAVKPGFAITAANAAAVAEICVRLDGLPLAIELAATRIELLTPQAMATRLEGHYGQGSLQLLTGGARDLPARQQTLRNLIDWSYNLLDDSDRTLFARLGVFIGGCAIEAAEAVCNATGGLDILNGLDSLTGKSLLRTATPFPIPTEGRDNPHSLIAGAGGDEARFTMLATVREYSVDQLRERGEMAAMLAQHADYYLNLVALAAPLIRGAAQVVWLRRLDADYDNIRAALGWLLAYQPALAIRMAGQLWRYWYMRGNLSEGREWLTNALAGATEDRHDLALALNGAGGLTMLQGDYAQADAYYRQSLQLRRELGDQAGIADTLNNLGIVSSLQGDYATARQRSAEYLTAARAMNDQPRVLAALNSHGYETSVAGDYPAARALLEEALQLARKLEYQDDAALALINLGNIAFEQGSYAEARTRCEQTLTIAQQLGGNRHITEISTILGLIACAEGDYEEANRQLEESLRLMQKAGDRWGIASAMASLGRAALAQHNYAAGRAHFVQSLRLFSAIGSKDAIAKTLILIGDSEAVRADKAGAVKAVKLISSGMALLNTTGAALPRSEATLKETALVGCRTALPTAEYEAAMAEGETMTMAQAIDYALTGEP